MCLWSFEYNQFTWDFVHNFLYLEATDTFLFFLFGSQFTPKKNHGCTKSYFPSWVSPFGCFLFLGSWTFSHRFKRIWFKFRHNLLVLLNDEKRLPCWDLHDGRRFSVKWRLACAQWRHNMAADIFSLEVTGRKNKQNRFRANPRPFRKKRIFPDFFLWKGSYISTIIRQKKTLVFWSSVLV